MNTQREKNEWTKNLGGIWFLCLFTGFITGGLGLFITIPIAIVCTIYAFWAEITGKKGQPTVSTNYQSYGGGIQNLDIMDIPRSGYSAAERAAEYCRRGQSPSGVIDGIYNDTQRPYGVAYSDTNRDWDAGA
ncbi:MAG: hypothetical protein WAV05_19245 [Anaerolineales bacterium]